MVASLNTLSIRIPSNYRMENGMQSFKIRILSFISAFPSITSVLNLFLSQPFVHFNHPVYYFPSCVRYSQITDNTAVSFYDSIRELHGIAGRFFTTSLNDFSENLAIAVESKVRLAHELSLFWSKTTHEHFVCTGFSALQLDCLLWARPVYRGCLVLVDLNFSVGFIPYAGHKKKVGVKKSPFFFWHCRHLKNCEY